MSLDPYQPCPACIGTDKKVKFCCAAIVGDMEKVDRLIESNQHQRAVELLRTLNERHPDNPRVATTLAAELMDEGEIGEARGLLHGVLKAVPDHPLALALLSLLAFAVEGYEDAKPIVHRALQKAAPVHPTMLARVVLGIAREQLVAGRFPSAREHLALALRLARDDEWRRDVFMRLLEFEGDGSIPYPLRSVHHLAPFDGPDEDRKRMMVALKLSHLGLWSEAAGLVLKLVEAHPESAALWQNLGFLRAWDGDERGAAEALHRAAELHADFETAVELETLAQLLELETTDEVVLLREREFEVPSVSRLLSEFDDRERVVRRDGEAGEGGPAGVFDVLDRPAPEGPLPADADPDDVPVVLGQIVLFASDAARDLPPHAAVVADDGAPLDATLAEFQAVLGDRARPLDEDAEDTTERTVPTELRNLRWRWHLPERTPLWLRRELGRREWNRVVDEVWPRTPLDALGGRTLEEARGDETARVRLAATIAVFDAHARSGGREIDVSRIRDRFGLPPVAPFPVGEGTQLAALSSMQLVRVPLGELSDERLRELVNRVLLVRHNDLHRRLLLELLERPGCRESTDLDQCHESLVQLERARHDPEAALAWIERGREAALAADDNFGTRLQWRLLELSVRADRQDDPGLAPLLDQLWNYFGAKLPELREQLNEMVLVAGIDPPWDTAASIGADFATSGTTTSGGIWTPGTAEPGGERKLFIPGQ